MDKGERCEGEGEKGEANNPLVSSQVICDDIVRLLHYAERCTDEDPYDLGYVEKIKLSLKIMLRLVQLSHLDDFNATMYRKSKEILSRKDLESAFSRLYDYIVNCVNSQHHSKSSATMPEEKLVELLDSLVMNLHDLSSAELISPFMTQYRALQNVCSTVRDFHRLKVNGFIEPEIVEFYTPQFQLMAERVGPLCWALLADINQYADSDEEDDLPQVVVMLAHLYMKVIHVHQEVMHICFTKLKDSKSAEVGHFINQLLKSSPDILREYLMYLEEHMFNVTSASTSARNIHVMIELLLVILTDIPLESIRHDKLSDLLARVGAVSKEVGVLVHSIEEDKSSNEESTNKMNCTILHLLEDLKHVYLKAPDPTELCFNMNDEPLFMNLLLGHLNDLLNSNAYSVALIKEEIGHVKEAMELIRSKFENVEQELHKDIWKRVLDVAYEAKHVIDSILARDDGLLHLVFSLPNAMKKIKVIKKEVSNLPEMIPKKRGLVVNSPNKPVKNMSSATSKIIVGFEEETDGIIRKLTNGPSELDVISIIGMPGLGKTTLAYKVYNDRSVISHFDIRAWCTVDQGYDRRMMLQKIYNQVTGLDEKFGEDTDVDDLLRKKLYGRRYLIVLDDLWDTVTWDDLTRPFPQIEKGSRIILTSRKEEVALYGKRCSDPLYLRLRSKEESWELLEKRVFGEESCPVELLGVAEEIAQNCLGLPLVVDLIAGVIAKSEKEESLWLEVLKNLRKFIFEDEVEVMRVIQLSYDHLSDHLKLCLLYLGSYRKDEEIKVNELKDLWSAEGFVEQTEMKRVEEVMEDYLDHLVSSSLLMVHKRKFGKRVCQIHDLVHDFCLIKARKEKLFELISSSAPSSSSYLMPRQLTIHFSDDPLTCHLRHLRLLRVLNLEGHDLPKYLLDEIGMLVHLRYLNIGSMEIEALPSIFSNLRNLETLVVRSDTTVMVEPVIWKLAKLRRVEIQWFLSFGSRTDEPTALADESKLENLRILEQLLLSYSKGGYDILKRFPNLQKLSCEIGDTWDSFAGCYRFPEFGFHNELEELMLYGPSYVIGGMPKDFPFFPSSLRSLTLVCGSVTSESLSTIARLPNLQELHLHYLRIQGNEWNMQEDDTFENLKILELFGVEISEWQVGEESFPVLEHLIFLCCIEGLKEIPSSFGDIYSLKCIQLIGSPQLEDSARQIKQYVEEIMGEDKLEVLVKS